MNTGGWVDGPGCSYRRETRDQRSQHPWWQRRGWRWWGGASNDAAVVASISTNRQSSGAVCTQPWAGRWGTCTLVALQVSMAPVSPFACATVQCSQQRRPSFVASKEQNVRNFFKKDYTCLHTHLSPNPSCSYHMSVFLDTLKPPSESTARYIGTLW